MTIIRYLCSGLTMTVFLLLSYTYISGASEEATASTYDEDCLPVFHEVSSILLPVTSPSGGLAWDGKSFWMADSTNETLMSISRNGTVGKSLNLPSRRITGMVRAGESLWVVNPEGPELLRISPDNGKILVSQKINIRNPGAMTSFRRESADGQSGAKAELLLVADRGENRIAAVNPATGVTTFSFPAPSGNTTGLAWNGRWLWVADGKDQSLYMVDPVSGLVVTIIRLEFSPSALCLNEGTLYVIKGEERRLTGITIDESRQYYLRDKREATVRCVAHARSDGELYIAVPPNLNRQKIVGNIEVSKETEIVLDQWGQPARRFQVKAGDEVEMKARTELYEIQYIFFPDRVGKPDDIPVEIKEQYLVDGKMLGLDDPVIKEAAQEILERNKGKNAYWLARDIFNYTFQHVPYKRAEGWLPAPETLKRGYGTCSPISFVFVALSRACGLPARFAAATRYRGSDPSWDTEFHRWAEVYLPGYGWVPVDPSGTNKDVSPAGQAGFFGHIPDIDLVMMVGGGGSELFKWGYNVGGVTGKVGFEWSKVSLSASQSQCGR